MKIDLHYFKISFIALLSIGILSCAKVKNSSDVMKKPQNVFTINNNAIPPLFGKTTSTLIVASTGKRSYEKYLKKNFEKYNGKYLIVNRDNLDDEQFDNKVKYRYLFDFRLVPLVDGQAKEFFIYDRLENTYYRAPKADSFYSKNQKKYIKSLNYELHLQRD